MSPKFQKKLSAVIGAIGIVLLVMMVTVEDEPGAIPLAMLLIAAVGYLSGRIRERSTKLS
jgi:hypothetical protein